MAQLKKFPHNLSKNGQRKEKYHILSLVDKHLPVKSRTNSTVSYYPGHDVHAQYDIG